MSAPRPRTHRSLVRVQVGRFALAGLVALALVGVATSIAARRVGEREAITEVRATAVARAQGLVTPALTDAIVDLDPTAVAAVARVVELGVVDESLVRVKLWRDDGTVLYSNEPALVGTRYPLGADEQASLRTGLIEAHVSDLAKPENRFEQSFGRLLEVYLPVYTPQQDAVLFEAYFRYDAVSSSGSRLFRSFAPIALGALVLLEIVQLPLAWSLARRLRQRLQEREGLLQRALDASEIERRQIATDLHDGVVQDLAGVAYALSAMARPRSDGPPPSPEAAPDAAGLAASAETVRSSIKALRSLLVELYPPNLAEEGLATAVEDLLAKVAARGVTTDLTAHEDLGSVPAPVAQLLYRAVQEALRNVVRHADASAVHVDLDVDGPAATARISDDGRGFEADGAGRPSEGHVGLRGLDGLVGDAGGTLSVRSTPGAGTTVTVRVPLS